MTLTRGQRQAVSFLAEGESADGIARILKVPVETVRSRIKAAYRKLDATNAPSAVLRAIELGELSVSQPTVTPAPVRESPDGSIAVYMPHHINPGWLLVRDGAGHMDYRKLRVGDVAEWRQLHYYSEGN